MVIDYDIADMDALNTQLFLGQSLATVYGSHVNFSPRNPLSLMNVKIMTVLQPRRDELDSVLIRPCLFSAGENVFRILRI